MSLVCRRSSDPLVVQQLWSAIRSIRLQKQVANEERIMKYIRHEYGNAACDVAASQLPLAVRDSLVILHHATPQKAGFEQDSYRMPDDEQVNGDHDWYCFECHRPGEVLECSVCWRVYHPACITSHTTENFICCVCQQVDHPPPTKPKELNVLLGFTVTRLKEKSTSLHWFGGAELGLDRFVHHYLDLNTVQARARQGYYSNLEQFHADVCTIRHNVHVCFGETGILQELARIMIQDCCYDLDEIRQCKDCYLHSNMKKKDWFCLPCRPAHDLVFAKQRGFGYWPAKVIKVTEAGYDVRFFGARHQRALVPTPNVRSVDTSTQALGVKRSAGFVRACAELARHRELLIQAAQQQVNKLEETSEEEDSEEEDDEKNAKIAPVHSKCGVPEDSFVVSSTEDNTRVSTCDVSSQTVKMMTSSGENGVNNSTQTDNKSLSCGPDCEARFEVKLRDFQTRVKRELSDQMQLSMEKLEQRLRKEFEEDEQKAVARAVATGLHNAELARQQAEKECREAYELEKKRITDSHAVEISAIKKKQWCYNCESEAMYHCCWNTSYCSIKCQQEHWHREHKRVCRRKRT